MHEIVDAASLPQVDDACMPYFYGDLTKRTQFRLSMDKLSLHVENDVIWLLDCDLISCRKLGPRLK